MIEKRFPSHPEFDNAKSQCRECCVIEAYGVVVCGDGCKNHPKVVVIGEAPGQDEVAEKRPFVGKSGKLLRKTLNQNGYRRENTLITNILPCRPKNNEFPLDDKLVRRCVERWLLQELALADPDFILLVGGKSLKFLLWMEGITKCRGQMYYLPDWHREVMCLPTFHPSYVLRKENEPGGDKIKGLFEQDIREVAIRAQFIKGD
jgi:DNA polymerase